METFLPSLVSGKKSDTHIWSGPALNPQRKARFNYSHTPQRAILASYIFFFPTITGRTRSNRAKATVIDMKAGFKMTVCHTESSFPTENISTEIGSGKDNPIWPLRSEELVGFYDIHPTFG